MPCQTFEKGSLRTKREGMCDMPEERAKGSSKPCPWFRIGLGVWSSDSWELSISKHCKKGFVLDKASGLGIEFGDKPVT